MSGLPIDAPPPGNGPAPVGPPPDGAELFPYLGRAGWRPLVIMCALATATIAPLVVLVLHRADLRIDLGLSADALDRAAGLALAGLLLAAFVASLATNRSNASTLLRAGAVLSGATAVVVAGVNDRSWLQVLVFAVVVFIGVPLALLRAYALDVYGPDGGWRIPGALWAGAGGGVFLVGLIEWVWPFPDWGIELALFGTVAVVGAIALPRARSADQLPPAEAVARARAATGQVPDAGPERPATDVVADRPPLRPGELAPFTVLAATAGLAIGAATPTALDLLRRSWDLDRGAVGAIVCLAGLLVAALCGLGHWYHHLADRPPAHLAGIAGAAMLVAGLLVAGGAASDTLIGVILAWAGACTAAALAAVCADAALLPPGPARPRHYRGAALVAAGVGGAAGLVLGPWMVDQVGRQWTMVAAAAPAAVIGWMVMVAYPALVPSADRARAATATALVDEPMAVADRAGAGHGAVPTPEPPPFDPNVVPMPLPVPQLDAMPAWDPAVHGGGVLANGTGNGTNGNGTNGNGSHADGTHAAVAAVAALNGATPVGGHGGPAGAADGRVELLRCAGIDAGYDGVQVLFGVDLTVTEGQIVALMGTNGAGKTTLLRTVSGLLGPTRGTVTFGGVDITGYDPTWRVRLGMNQIAGGESLAPGLTVAENLRMFSYSLGRKHARATAGIDAALEQFPRLGERRNQPASTLSGGEKQMLALAKAFVLRPRLLVIDEFSLGLAPKIVGELLPVVTQINQAGTSVLLVEQSVNVALSIAHHAYCMEKGEIVYDGSAEALRDEPDLLRSVYLEGISRAVAT